MLVLCRRDLDGRRTSVCYDMSSIWSCLYQVGEETKRQADPVERSRSILSILGVNLLRIHALLEQPSLALRHDNQEHHGWDREIVIENRTTPREVLMREIDEHPERRLYASAR